MLVEGRESIPGPHSAHVTRPIVLLLPASVIYGVFTLAASFDSHNSLEEEAEQELESPLHTGVACSSSHKELEEQLESELGLLPISQTILP